MQKNILLILALVILVAGVAVFSRNIEDTNQIVTLAIADTGTVTLAQYNRVQIELDSGSYYLTPYFINKDRKNVNLLLKSNPDTEFFQRYFGLDFGRKAISMFRQPEQVYILAQVH